MNQTNESNKIIIVVRNGDVTDVRIPNNMELDIEVLLVDKDYSNYEKLREYEDKIYEDSTMRSADLTTIE